MSTSTPEWQSWGKSGQAIDPKTSPTIKDLTDFSGKLENISNVLGVVLEILSIAKQFALL